MLSFLPSRNRIDVVVPGEKIFSHSMRESWRIHLEKAGISHQWLPWSPGQEAVVASKLAKAGVVILLNDHHLGKLVSYLENAGNFGKGRDSRAWIGVSTERVIGSPFPNSEEKTRACARLCHLMAHFDPAAGNLFREEEAEAIFMHQYVDALTFNSETPFDRKAGGVLWVGKLPDGHTPKEYESRRRCFEAIRRLEGFSWREACRPDLPIRKIVRERDSYQALLNLPSNCPGYTSTFFEHLVMGAVVLQYRTGTPLPEGLQPGKHFLEYDPDRPEHLVSLVRTVADNPSRYQEMAQQARQECLAKHTLALRLESLFQKASLCLSGRRVDGVDQVTVHLLERAKDKITRMLEKEKFHAR